MELLPGYSKHMTKDVFLDSIKAGAYIDYDGYGCYATVQEMSDVQTWPSKVVKEGWDERFTHIVWFNR